MRFQQNTQTRGKAKIVSLLKKYKMDVYADLTSRKAMIDRLIEFGYSVRAGQKRLVVRDMSDPSYVYKIAYSTNGLVDNINEVACSERLKELLDERQITHEDLKLFCLAELVDDDPFIIKQELAVTYDEYDKFNNWFDTVGGPAFPKLQRSTQFVRYVSSIDQLRSDANTIQAIITSHFAGSDAQFPKEPDNDGIRTFSGIDRLCLLDMGSIVPLLRDINGEYIRPTCSTCNRDTLTYVPVTIQKEIATEVIANVTGVYGCMDPNCPDYYKNIDFANGINSAHNDAVVVTRYMNKYALDFKILKAEYGKYFIPNRACSDINSYNMEIVNTLNYTPSYEDLKAMWNNFSFREAGRIFTQVEELQKLYVEMLDNPNIPYTYDQFFEYGMDEINKVLTRSNNNNAIVFKTLAILYLDGLCADDNELFDAFLSEDKVGFMSALAKFALDNNSINNLWSDMHAE